MANQALEKTNAQAPEAVQPSLEKRVYLPATDIIETSNHWMLIADMPGVDERSLEVNIERDTLTIEGRVESTGVPKGYAPAYTEYGLGNFRRSFTLSREVDRDGIEASIKNGVL